MSDELELGETVDSPAYDSDIDQRRDDKDHNSSHSNSNDNSHSGDCLSTPHGACHPSIRAEDYENATLYCIFVLGLPSEVDDIALYHAFKKFGKIFQANIVRDKSTK